MVRFIEAVEIGFEIKYTKCIKQPMLWVNIRNAALKLINLRFVMASRTT